MRYKLPSSASFCYLCCLILLFLLLHSAISVASFCYLCCFILLSLLLHSAISVARRNLKTRPSQFRIQKFSFHFLRFYFVSLLCYSSNGILLSCKSTRQVESPASRHSTREEEKTVDPSPTASHAVEQDFSAHQHFFYPRVAGKSVELTEAGVSFQHQVFVYEQIQTFCTRIQLQNFIFWFFFYSSRAGCPSAQAATTRETGACT